MTIQCNLKGFWDIVKLRIEFNSLQFELQSKETEKLWSQETIYKSVYGHYNYKYFQNTY